MIRPRGLSARVLAIASVVSFVVFLFAAAGSLAAATYHVKIGGEYMGSPLAKGGMVWFNGYDPAVIVIQPGDTVEWELIGGVHTVTSAGLAANGSFVFDSSPLFPPEAALADMGPGKLLAPGSVFELDTSGLPAGTYRYICKIHPGMQGNLTITIGVPSSAVVNLIAGWGDHLYAVQAFAPQDVTVEQGTIVRWTLMNPMEPHTITGFNSTNDLAWDSSPDFNPTGPPPVMLSGQKFSHTFAAAGTFTYFCKLHAYKVGQSWVGMTGTVHVVPLTAVDALGTLSGVSYAALLLSIVALVVAVYPMIRKGSSGGSAPKP